MLVILTTEAVRAVVAAHGGNADLCGTSPVSRGERRRQQRRLPRSGRPGPWSADTAHLLPGRLNCRRHAGDVQQVNRRPDRHAGRPGLPKCDDGSPSTAQTDAVSGAKAFPSIRRQQLHDRHCDLRAFPQGHVGEGRNQGHVLHHVRGDDLRVERRPVSAGCGSKSNPVAISADIYSFSTSSTLVICPPCWNTTTARRGCKLTWRTTSRRPAHYSSPLAHRHTTTIRQGCKSTRKRRQSAHEKTPCWHKQGVARLVTTVRISRPGR